MGRYDVVRTGHRQFVSLHFSGAICAIQAITIPMVGWGLAAVTDLVVWHAPIGEVRAVLRRAPSLATAFWREGLIEANRVARRLVDVGRRDAVARVANLLCQIAVTLARSDATARSAFDLPFTQADIADVVGLTSVHVNRVIGNLRARGLVRLERHRVEIRDWGALAAIGQFNEVDWWEHRVD